MPLCDDCGEAEVPMAAMKCLPCVEKHMNIWRASRAKKGKKR